MSDRPKVAPPSTRKHVMYPDPSVAAHTLTLLFSGEFSKACVLLASPAHAFDFALVCVPSVAAVTGSAWLLMRTRSAWARRTFESTINFSLTSFRGNRLMLRTVREVEVDQCMHSEGVDALLKATARSVSTDERPQLVHMASTEAKVVRNKLLNEISSQFSMGFLVQDIAPVTNAVRCSPYGFALTCGHGALGGHKMRVVLASARTMRKAVELRDAGLEPKYEHPLHAQRFSHILLMHEALVDAGLLLDKTSDEWVDERIRRESTSAKVGVGRMRSMAPIVGLMELCVRL